MHRWFQRSEEYITFSTPRLDMCQRDALGAVRTYVFQAVAATSYGQMAFGTGYIEFGLYPGT
jgi:hypothetical protein